MIEAIIMDFDGVILETEGPIFQSWQEAYRKYGCRLTYEDWSAVIGIASGDFDPFAALEAQLGQPVDRAKEGANRLQRELELVYRQPVMPGVVEFLKEARLLGFKIGLASSSSYAWVGGHLTRLGLLEYFDVIRTNDDVKRGKPDPDLYLAALQGLHTRPDRAIALEDSYHGVRSAQLAGIFCVAVPTEMTRRLPVEQADLCIDSLTSLPLPKLIAEVERIKNGH
jgi:HAD superfamily hydrolase (TIGR01509 family)